MSENETMSTIFATIDDLAIDFVEYGRREDEELSREDLERAIERGKPTIGEIVKRFRSKLLEELGWGRHTDE